MSLTFWIVIAGIACLAIWLFLRWFNRKNSVEVYTPRDEDQWLRKLERDLDDRDLFESAHKQEIERDFRQYLNWLKKSETV